MEHRNDGITLTCTCGGTAFEVRQCFAMCVKCRRSMSYHHLYKEMDIMMANQMFSDSFLFPKRDGE